MIWDTVQTALPQLLSLLPAAVEAAGCDAAQGDRPDPTAAS